MKSISNIRRGATRGRSKRRSRRRQNGGDSIAKFSGDAWSLAKRAVNGLNEIRKLINIETKILDKVQGATAFDNTGGILAISRIAQGTDYNTRVGDSIKVQYLELRARVTMNTSATYTDVRILLIRDLDGYGTIPTTADVLESVGSATAPLSPMKYLNRTRFGVLVDEHFVLDLVGTPTICFDWSQTMEKHIKYLGTTAAAASDGKGSFYWVIVSNEATNTPSYTLSTRMLFTDD